MLPDLAVLAAVYLLALLPRWRGLGHCVLAVRTVFFIYLVCVLGVTLLPVLANLPKLAGNHYALMELEPFRDLRNGYGNAARQLSLNVVMTVPFGFLWPLVRRKRGLCRAVLAALLLSLCIELLQPLLTTNRTSDITDVIANTAGGLVGYLLCPLVPASCISAARKIVREMWTKCRRVRTMRRMEKAKIRINFSG